MLVDPVLLFVAFCFWLLLLRAVMSVCSLVVIRELQGIGQAAPEDSATEQRATLAQAGLAWLKEKVSTVLPNLLY